jgi:F0F1-type ATP synthase beta subunit
MSSTDELLRRLPVVENSSTVEVRVGTCALSRISNAIGEPIDDKGSLATGKKSQFAGHQRRLWTRIRVQIVSKRR